MLLRDISSSLTEVPTNDQSERDSKMWSILWTLTGISCYIFLNACYCYRLQMYRKYNDVCRVSCELLARLLQDYEIVLNIKALFD